MVILLGLLGGKLFHRFHVPAVTGYMITGLVLGPSVLGFISTATLDQIHLVNEIALGLILFAIGGEIQWQHLKSMGTKVLSIALAESFGAFLLVFCVTYAIQQDLSLAFLLGAISMATAPGVTLLVIREYHARGPLTDTLLAVVAINNVLCLVIFRILFAGYNILLESPVSGVLWHLALDLAGSVVIGAIIGWIITIWEQRINDLSELLLVIIGGLLIGIGIANTIGISYLLICLVIGAVTNNLSMMHRLVYAELRQTEMPFYIAFFVLSGASLHLSALMDLGFLGLAYLIVRPAGKYVASYFVARKCKFPDVVSTNLGMALIPQAGVAIGLVITVMESQPDLGQIIGTVIFSSVIVYEGIGPFFTRLGLKRANEIHLIE
jgi:Kef-type K+ transport system membrane component KefB